MFDLGIKPKNFLQDLLQEIDLQEYQTSTPDPYADDFIICGYEQGFGERVLVCETAEDIQKIHDAYTQGGARSIKWYKGSMTEFITQLRSYKDAQEKLTKDAYHLMPGPEVSSFHQIFSSLREDEERHHRQDPFDLNPL